MYNWRFLCCGTVPMIPLRASVRTFKLLENSNPFVSMLITFVLIRNIVVAIFTSISLNTLAWLTPLSIHLAKGKRLAYQGIAIFTLKWKTTSDRPSTWSNFTIDNRRQFFRAFLWNRYWNFWKNLSSWKNEEKATHISHKSLAMTIVCWQGITLLVDLHWQNLDHKWHI